MSIRQDKKRHDLLFTLFPCSFKWVEEIIAISVMSRSQAQFVSFTWSLSSWAFFSWRFTTTLGNRPRDISLVEMCRINHQGKINCLIVTNNSEQSELTSNEGSKRRLSGWDCTKICLLALISSRPELCQSRTIQSMNGYVSLAAERFNVCCLRSAEIRPLFGLMGVYRLADWDL